MQSKEEFEHSVRNRTAKLLVEFIHEREEDCQYEVMVNMLYTVCHAVFFSVNQDEEGMNVAKGIITMCANTAFQEIIKEESTIKEVKERLAKGETYEG